MLSKLIVYGSLIGIRRLNIKYSPAVKYYFLNITSYIYSALQTDLRTFVNPTLH